MSVLCASVSLFSHPRLYRKGTCAFSLKRVTVFGRDLGGLSGLRLAGIGSRWVLPKLSPPALTSLSCLPGFALGKLSGRVGDPTASPMPGASPCSCAPGTQRGLSQVLPGALCVWECPGFLSGRHKSLSGKSCAGQRGSVRGQGRGSSDQGQQCALLRPQKLLKPPAARPTPWTAQPGIEELLGRTGEDGRAGSCWGCCSHGANKGKWGLWEGRRPDPDPDPAQPEAPWAAASLSPPAHS